MKKLTAILLSLLPFALFAQYPAAPNKLRQGYQTTAQGLIYYSDTIPTHTPSSFLHDTEMVVDTVNDTHWAWTGYSWRLENTIRRVTPPPATEVRGGNTLDYRYANWWRDTDSTLYVFNWKDECWQPKTPYRSDTEPTDEAAIGSSAAVCFTSQLWYETDVDSLRAYTGGSWIAIGTGSGGGGGGGSTNLSYTASPTDGTVTSDTGTDATIPAGSATNASLMLPSDKTKLDGIESGATADQTAIEMPITDAGGYFIATEVESALQEEAVNRLAVDAIAGALTSLSGMPLLSTDLGTFTGNIIANNNTNKGALQELETAVEANQDSITALRGDIGSGSGSGIGGTLTDNAIPVYNSGAGEFEDSGITDDGTTISTDRHIDRFRTLYPSFNRFSASGSNTDVVLNTGIDRTAVSASFVYVDASYYNQSSGNFSEIAFMRFKFRVDNTGVPSTGQMQIVGDWPRDLTAQLGYRNSTGEVVITFPKRNGRYLVEKIDVTSDAVILTPDDVGFTQTSDLTSYTLSSMEVRQASFAAGAQGFTPVDDGNVVGLAIGNSAGSSNNTVSFHMVPSQGPDGSGQDLTNGVKLVAHDVSTSGGGGDDLAIELPTVNPSATPVEYFRFQRGGNFGIQTTTPGYAVDIGGTSAAIRLTPHDNTLVNTEGLLFPDDSENRLKYYDGATLQSLAFLSDITGGGTMSSWTLVTDDAIDMTVSDADNVDITGGLGVDVNNPGVGAGAVVNMNLELIPVSEPLDGAERLLVYDSDGTNFHQLLDIDDLATYANTGVALANTVTSGRPAQWNGTGNQLDAFPLENTLGLVRQTQSTAFEMASGTTGLAPLATTAGRIRWNTTLGKMTVSDGAVHQNVATEDYVSSQITSNDPDLNYSEDTDLVFTPDVPVEHVTLNTTGSASSDTDLSLPTAGPVYAGYQVVVWSIDSNGTHDNTISASTIQNGASTSGSISLNNFQSTTVACILVGASSYRWVVTNQY